MSTERGRTRRARRGPRRWPPAIAIPVLVALTGLVGFPSATTATTEGPSEVYISRCPEPVVEHDWYGFQVRMFDDRPMAGYILRFEPGTADATDYYDRTSVNIGPNPANLSFPTRLDDLYEGEETFTIAVGSNDDQVGVNPDQRCEVTIIDEDETLVRNVEVSSTPADGDTYRAGETITVDVTFEDRVRVNGTPVVTLWFDDSGSAPLIPPANSWQWRDAGYIDGTENRTLRFAYEVRTSDVDTDGLVVAPLNAIGMGEGRIMSLWNHHDALHTFTGLSTGQKVDGRLR